MSKKIASDETAEMYISRRIDEIFLDLADELSARDMDVDTAAGIPLELFVKMALLKRAWSAIVSDCEI